MRCVSQVAIVRILKQLKRSLFTQVGLTLPSHNLYIDRVALKVNHYESRFQNKPSHTGTFYKQRIHLPQKELNSTIQRFNKNIAFSTQVADTAKSRHAEDVIGFYVHYPWWSMHGKHLIPSIERRPCAYWNFARKQFPNGKGVEILS